jgi:KUP system potassium uptake protein
LSSLTAHTFITIATEPVPRIAAAERVTFEDRGNGLYVMRLRYGFMQVPDVPTALRLAEFQGGPIDPDEATYFIGHRYSLVSERAGPGAWRQRLFTLLQRNAADATEHYNIPAEQVITVGIPLSVPPK